jgi:phosphosulfolactate synthase
MAAKRSTSKPTRGSSKSARGKQKSPKKKMGTWEYLRMIGVPDFPARTHPFDPGYDPVTLISHLEQSSHLISTLKISMACWQVANEKATREKIRAAQRLKVPTCTGGGPFEVASTFGKLPEFLDLCADVGVSMIEAGEGFTDQELDPRHIIGMAEERGLQVQFEVGKKHGGTCRSWSSKGCGGSTPARRRS